MGSRQWPSLRSHTSIKQHFYIPQNFVGWVVSYLIRGTSNSAWFGIWKCGSTNTKQPSLCDVNLFIPRWVQDCLPYVSAVWSVLISSFSSSSSLFWAPYFFLPALSQNRATRVEIFPASSPTPPGSNIERHVHNSRPKKVWMSHLWHFWGYLSKFYNLGKRK